MSSKIIFAALAFALAIPCASGQVIINEFYTGTPDFVELYNAGPVAANVGGWTVQTYQGNGLTPETAFTIPAGTMIAADDYLVLEENGTAGAAGTLGACAIRTGFNYNWTSTRTVVVTLSNGGGVGVDYVYRDQGGPAGAPNLPAGLTWTGTLADSGDTVARHRTADSDDASDWEALAGSSQSPCARNPNVRPLVLTITSGGAGAVSVDISSDPAIPNAEFYTLVSGVLQSPLGSGPVFGLGLDVLGQFSTPLIPGSPFHSNLSVNGGYSANFPAGSVPVGLTIQAVTIVILPTLNIATTDVVEVTF